MARRNSKPFSSAMKTRPDDDQIEVTLLGRGIGESCVVHLGGGEWMIVDSFLDKGVPAARRYLDGIKVPPDSVKILVVTHFHRDHYRGIDALHRYYSQARLMITDALLTEDFLALYFDRGEPGPLGKLPETVIRATDRMLPKALVDTVERAKGRTIGEYTTGLFGLKVASKAWNGVLTQMMALSPTGAAVLQSSSEIAAALKTGRTAVTSQLKNDNRCSVVLHLEAQGAVGLLCADLVADAPAYGWQAILDEPVNKNLPPAQLVKAPHHGSKGAHHDGMWEKLVDGDPAIVVAPYWSKALPRETDAARMCGRGRLWQAAPSKGYYYNDAGMRISLPVETGIVRARRRVGGEKWEIATAGAAFRVELAEAAV